MDGNMRMTAPVLMMILLGCMYTAKQATAATQDEDLLYRAKCAACHRVYPPKKYTYQTLREHVTTYGKGLGGEERRRLLEYLRKNAKQEQGGVAMEDS